MNTTGFSRKDIIRLADMIGGIRRARRHDNNGNTYDFIYYFPRDRDGAPRIFKIFQKYNIPAEIHKTSLNNGWAPIVCIPADIRDKNIIKMLNQLSIVQEARAKCPPKNPFVVARDRVIWKLDDMADAVMDLFRPSHQK